MASFSSCKRYDAEDYQAQHGNAIPEVVSSRPTTETENTQSCQPFRVFRRLAMAPSWISLADLAERNSHLDRIDETFHSRNGPPSSVASISLARFSIASPTMSIFWS
jgi:hypothetical protein